MDRRDFLLASTAGAAAVSSSCASLTMGGAIVGSLRMGETELAEYLARVDRGLEAIASGTILPQTRDLSPTASAAERDEVAREERLAKLGLRALLFTSAFNDLDGESRQHPEVQRRLAQLAPEFDEAVLGMTGRIAELDQARAAEIHRVLRDDPELGLKISEELDRPARLLEVPLRRRLQARSMLTHFAWRMRVQSPTVVADEYLTKMHKVAAVHGKAEGLRRELAARMTEEAFWRYQDLVAQADPGADEPGASRPVPPASRPGSQPTTHVAPVEPRPATKIQSLEPEPRKNRGGGFLKGGGITLGIGAVVFGIGAALVFSGTDAAIPGAFMMTFGGIGILVGLILLIVGAVLRSRSK